MNRALERAARVVHHAWWVLPVFALALALLLVFQLLGLDHLNDGASVTTTESTIRRDYDVGPNPSLTIDTWRGDVTVHAEPGTHITLTIVLRGAGANQLSAQRDVQRMATAIDQDGTGIRVTTRAGRTDEPAQSFARIEVGVPPGARVAITTGGGTVEVSGLEGNLLAVTRLGDILVRVPPGRAFQVDATRSLKTDLELQQQRPPAGMKVRAISGTAPAQFLTLQAPGGIRLEEVR
ncbi:MAG: hypothetical protein IT304_02520 [Dehalococcoidia bacterium]|nr:hypothetical protein [Dehalococcoidia bacterium]